MIETFADIAPADLSRFDDIIDVRSPGEFAEDHIPGAINLPVLGDAERAEVGAIYTQHSKFRARRIGAAYVAANVARHLGAALAEKPPAYRPLLYCWRGGMRSNAMATILSQIGWRVGVLKGGYKTWRRAVVEGLRKSEAPFDLVLLDGQTGTAKSEVLARLARLGVQTIDLEALAVHRGSVFGGHAARPQPSQKLFESGLWQALGRVDSSQSLLVEAESNRIGSIVLPRRLWASMAAAPRIVLEADVSVRAAYTVRTYADLVRDPSAVIAAIDRLSPFHAKPVLEAWRELARAGAFESLAAALMKEHYDPLYIRGGKRRDDAPVGCVRLQSVDEASLVAAAGAVKEMMQERAQMRTAAMQNA